MAGSATRKLTTSVHAQAPQSALPKQGLGTGTRLFRHLEAMARFFGFPMIELSVHATNTGAINFYKQMGMVEVRASAQQFSGAAQHSTPQSSTTDSDELKSEVPSEDALEAHSLEDWDGMEDSSHSMEDWDLTAREALVLRTR